MKYDFIDIGSSKGGSIQFCKKRFGSNGWGMDIDPKKVKQAVEAGYDCRLMDIQDIKEEAKWCTALHVIEHLSGREEAQVMIEKMLEIGDKVYLVWPYFDADSYLFRMGYKLFWSDWEGHPYHCTSLEIHNILTDIGVDYEVEYYLPITSTRHVDILPLSAPRDSHGYTEDMDEKKEIGLENVYREIRITI